MKNSSLWMFLLGGVFLLWCSGCETGEDLENSEDYEDPIPTITDGVPTNGYPSVGLLNNSCTATLVGKRSVLTAAHCVTNGGRANFVVGGTRYSSSQVFAHNTGDIALVILSRDVTNVKPSALNTSTPKVGQGVTLVGFGQTSENGGGFGKKRMGTNIIDKVDSESIYFRGSGNGSSSNCYGDSGGPAFMVINNQEVVAGVTSGGREPCGTYAWDTRVDVFVSWLKQKSNGDVLLPGNTSDQCPNDPNKTEPGECGCGVPEGSCGTSSLYEAESYSSQSGCAVQKTHSGYEGQGYVDYGGNGTWIQWNKVKVASAGQYKLAFRYANGGAKTRGAAIRVNGVVKATVAFTSTQSWTTWTTAQVVVSLPAGSHSIRVTASTDAGGPNLDNMKVSR